MNTKEGNLINFSSLEFQTNFISYQKVQGMNNARKNVAIAEVNEVANKSNVQLDFQGIQTTNEPDLVNYFKCLVQGSNELYPPETWEGAKILYQYIFESTALV